MKTPLNLTLAVSLLVSPFALANQALRDDPAYLNIDEVIDREKAKPTVNVNLPKFLLNNAIKDFELEKDSPLAAAGVDLKEIIEGIKLVRLMVIEGDESNEAYLNQAVATLRKTLESQWTPIVSVPDDGVGVYAMSDASGETMAGLALLVQDDEDIVVANLVGELPIGKLLGMAARLGGDLEDLVPPELLEQLAGMHENKEGVVETGDDAVVEKE